MLSTTPARRRLISADSHLDLPWIPPRLWQERLPAALRERGPRVVETGESGSMWVWEDRTHAASAAGTNNAPLLKDFYGDFGVEMEPGALPPSDPKLVSAHLDGAGVTAQVMFPPVDGFIFQDERLGLACVRAYNEFALTLDRDTGGRIVPLAIMPTGSPEACAAEARWAVENGFRGLEFNALLAGRPLWDPVWEEFWDAVESSGVPLCMHISATPGVEPVRTHGQWPSYVVQASFAILDPILSLLFSGVLDRRPGLRVLLGECRVGWLPFVIQQAEDTARERYTDVKLSSTPTEIWHRQIAATFEEDRLGARLLAEPWANLAGTVMWASDYPHNHRVCFDPHPVLDDIFADVPDDIADHACYGKAAEWFGV
ncbi:amidohydrolase family protein [Streptosporangium sp. DT93]|uniref:amidohydrolase family protein n=1 Tax=Streptosporangium sp. DT93 TaxID=3393428 RepID=UPI003CF0F9E6